MSSQATRAVGRHGSNHKPSTPPANIPPGYVGEVVLPETGRLVWWTGRVSIGLRYQPRQNFEPVTHSAYWIQKLMLENSKMKTHTGRSKFRVSWWPFCRAINAGETPLGPAVWSWASRDSFSQEHRCPRKRGNFSFRQVVRLTST